MKNIQINTANLQRFAVHLLFAALAGAASYFADNAGLLELGAERTGLVVAVVTAAGSFFRARA